MILSMTGFGRGVSKDKKRSYSVEIKSVNHRFLEIKVRLPKEIGHFEPGLRELFSDSLSRGSVDVVVNRVHRFDEEDIDINLNLALAREYHLALDRISKSLKLKSRISAETISKFPEVLELTIPPIDDKKEYALINKAIKPALLMLLKMRREEGRNLMLGINKELQIIENGVRGLMPLRERVISQYRHRLHERIKKFDIERDLDETRIAQEVAIYADRSDIYEELSRLQSHISQFRGTLKERGAVGRKLDFLVQELLRETNTIGSKFPEAVLGKLIEMKSSIEKLKEQVQNIE